MGGYGWGNVQESELLDAISEALDKGVNFFDTADTYGLGQSERTLAKGLGERRKNVVIESKFGVCVGGGKTVYDNSPEYIQTALEESLRRLNTDYIDIYTIHYRDGKTPIADVIGKLDELKAAGKIRHYGLSNIHGNEADELIPYAEKFVCCQDEFSLACRKNEADLFSLQSKYGADVKFGTDDRRSREIYVNFHGEKLKQNLCIVEVLKKIAENHGRTVAACAIRWILDTLPESVVIAGVKRPSQLDSNIEAMDWHLGIEEMKELNEVAG